MNYYDDTRISQSKVKAYLRCPHLYRQQFVEKVYEPKKTKDMQLGSALDCVLTTTMSLEEAGIRLTPAMQKMCDAMVLRVCQQPIMQDLAWLEKQKELYTDEFKGKLDYFGIKGNQATIMDLKTCPDTNKFEFSIHDFSYILQLAFYKMLVKANYPQVRRWKFYLAAVDKTKEVKFAMFEVSAKRVAREEKWLKLVLKDMKAGVRLASGPCKACPPELGCFWSMISKKDIIKI